MDITKEIKHFLTYNKETKEYNFEPIIIPDSWSRLKLYKYQELQTYYKSLEGDEKVDIIKILSILTDKSEDDIRLLPIEFINKLMDKTKYLSETPNPPISNYLTIKNEKYYINPLEKLTFGEWVDVNTAMQNNNDDIVTILAILCRKTNEKYDDDYINNKFKDRLEMFRNITVIEAMSVVGFFLKLCQLSITYSPHYIKAILEELEGFANNIENSLRTGARKNFYTFLQKRRLKKYRKLLNQISQTV